MISPLPLNILNYTLGETCTVPEQEQKNKKIHKYIQKRMQLFVITYKFSAVKYKILL